MAAAAAASIRERQTGTIYSLLPAVLRLRWRYPLPLLVALPRSGCVQFRDGPPSGSVPVPRALRAPPLLSFQGRCQQLENSAPHTWFRRRGFRVGSLLRLWSCPFSTGLHKGITRRSGSWHFPPSLATFEVSGFVSVHGSVLCQF